MIFGRVAQNHALTVQKKANSRGKHWCTESDRIEQDRITSGTVNKNSERHFVTMVVTEQKLTNTYSLINKYLDSETILR